MAENLFEPGKKSQCMFAPNLGCDYWKPSSEPVAPFEFFCDIIPETVLVVLPVDEGKKDRTWQNVFSTIERVWEAPDIGFTCVNTDVGAWIEEKPCSACRRVRQAQVVVLEYQGDNTRATAFRDMALGSQQSLQVMSNFLPAPKKRIIVINSTRAVPPPHFKRVFDWIDYAGADGSPDLAILRSEMERIARLPDLALSNAAVRHGPQPEADDAVASQIRFVNHPVSPSNVVVKDDEGEFEMNFLGTEPVAPEVPLPERPRVPRIEIEKTPAVVRTASIAHARELANEKKYAAAFRELVAAEKAGAGEREVRDLEHELVTAMPAGDLADVYFSGLTTRPRASYLKLRWNPGSPSEGLLTVEGGEIEGFGPTLYLYAADGLDDAAAEKLRASARAHAESGHPVLIVVGECNPSICEKFAGLRNHKVFEIHVPDLRRWALSRKPVTDGLRERRRDRYQRSEDLFLRGIQGPVGSEERFFGRQTLLDRLQGSLRTGGGFVVHGLPRSGKSSILWRLARSGTNGSLRAVVDLQNCVVDESPDLYVRTLRAIREAALASGLAVAEWAEVTEGNKLFSLTPAAPVTRFHDEFEAGIKELVSSLRRRDELFERIDLLLDDLGSLTPLTTQTFLKQVVKLKQQGLLAVGVSASAFSLQRELHESPLQEISEFFAVGLEDEECVEMIRGIGHLMYSYFDDEAVDEMIRASGGHPLLVRSLCSVVLETKNGNTIVGGQAVKKGIESAMAMKSVRQWLERTIQDVDRHLPSGKALLEAMVQADGAANGRRARPQNLDYGSPAFERNLSMLRDYGFLPSAGGFQLRIGLLKRWIQQREAET
jgi:hypothetical protein